MKESDKKHPVKEPEKERPDNKDQDVEFGSKNGERINSSPSTHSNQIGGAGGSDSESDIISK